MQMPAAVEAVGGSEGQTESQSVRAPPVGRSPVERVGVSKGREAEVLSGS